MCDESLIIPPGQTLPPMLTEEERKAVEARHRPAGKQKQTGRFHVLNTFVDASLRNVKKSAAKVWLILYRDTRDGLARTGQQDIARRAGVSDRTVRTALRELERGGLLVVHRKGSLNRGPSVYRVRSTPDNQDP